MSLLGLRLRLWNEGNPELEGEIIREGKGNVVLVDWFDGHPPSRVNILSAMICNKDELLPHVEADNDHPEREEL